MGEFGPGCDFINQYRTISNKLKKRFLRKPNVTEACSDFTSLASRCEAVSMLPQAGICWMAAARCEADLGNASGETNCLTRAARQFLTAEIRQKEIGCPSVGRENLQAATGCYNRAVNKHTSLSPLSTCLLLELGSEMEKHFSVTTAEQLYTEASTTGVFFCVPRLRIEFMKNVISSRIKQGNYAGALSALSDVGVLLEEVTSDGVDSELYIDTKRDCEISRLLLLLILQPTPQRLAVPLAALLDKYTWGSYEDPSLEESGISQVLFILLQSLVMACQAKDASILPQLEGDLRPHLSSEQRCLSAALLHQYP